ncbi:MAG: HAD hydrolase-like protein, partial [Candidatus Lokiarchaeota archaeon]|nr:HAD hydrolase-like protein [Candidatus Lokiarchaeota archaeon]MBD3340461.1 HAD hydrolase-like protein [Candidatus Lokiarchaeota archaeon]
PDNKIAIVSNTADYIVDFMLQEFGIKDLFHEVLGLAYDYDQKIAKPSPKGIISVLDRLNFDSSTSHAIMVGDSRVDVIAAKRANIHACLLLRDNKYEKEQEKEFKSWGYKPDLIIDSLYELINLI